MHWSESLLQLQPHRGTTENVLSPVQSRGSVGTKVSPSTPPSTRCTDVIYHFEHYIYIYIYICIYIYTKHYQTPLNTYKTFHGSSLEQSFDIHMKSQAIFSRNRRVSALQSMTSSKCSKKSWQRKHLESQLLQMNIQFKQSSSRIFQEVSRL